MQISRQIIATAKKLKNNFLKFSRKNRSRIGLDLFNKFYIISFSGSPEQFATLLRYLNFDLQFSLEIFPNLEEGATCTPVDKDRVFPTPLGPCRRQSPATARAKIECRFARESQIETKT